MFAIDKSTKCSLLNCTGLGNWGIVTSLGLLAIGIIHYNDSVCLYTITTVFVTKGLAVKSNSLLLRILIWTSLKKE